MVGYNIFVIKIKYVKCHPCPAFAGLNPDTYELLVLNPPNDLYDDGGNGTMDRFTDLKKVNPDLKTVLSVGGWGEGARDKHAPIKSLINATFLADPVKYSEMARTPETRSTFINSTLNFVLEHNFDGVDMDWEYPGN